MTANISNTTAFASDYLGTTTCRGSAAPDVAFAVTVPAGQSLSVVVTPSSGFDPTLSIVDAAAACGVTCVATVDTGANGGSERLTVAASTTARTLFIVVDGYMGSTGAFGVLASLSSAPADDTCAGATPLTGLLSGQSNASYTNDYWTDGTSQHCVPRAGDQGPDRVYSVTVPPGQRGVVSVTNPPGFDASLTFMDGAATCTAQPRVCLAGTDVWVPTSTETLSFYNASTAPRTLLAIVDSDTPGVGGSYDVAFATSTPVADDVCSTGTTTLVSGVPVSRNLDGFVDDYGRSSGNCFGYGGPDRAYRAMSLPAGQKLSVTVTCPFGNQIDMDPILSFFPAPGAACDALPRTCVAAADFSDQEVEKGGLTNTTGAPMELFVVVGDFQPSASTTAHTLTATVGPPPVGESCATPQVVSGTAVLGGDLDGASADVRFANGATACALPSYHGVTNALPDVIYSLSLTPNQRLTATATSFSTNDLVLNLVEGQCANVTACLASANVGGAGVSEVLNYQNTSGTTKAVLLQVAGTQMTTFNLSLTVQ